jgi:hypothetical protein
MKPLSKWQQRLIALGVIVLLMVGCNVRYMFDHPAPLGRSSATIQERVGRLFPPGTSIDSVKHRMESLHIPVWSEEDSAGVHQLGFRERKAALPIPWSSDFIVRFFFDTHGHLLKSTVEEHQLAF